MVHGGLDKKVDPQLESCYDKKRSGTEGNMGVLGT